MTADTLRWSNTDAGASLTRQLAFPGNNVSAKRISAALETWVRLQPSTVPEFVDGAHKLARAALGSAVFAARTVKVACVRADHRDVEVWAVVRNMAQASVCNIMDGPVMSATLSAMARECDRRQGKMTA